MCSSVQRGRGGFRGVRRRDENGAMPRRAVVREVGPYELSEVASSLVAWPACAAFGSRRLTLARERRTCVVSPSSAPFSCARARLVGVVAPRCVRFSVASGLTVVRNRKIAADRGCHEVIRRAASGYDGCEGSKRIVVSLARSLAREREREREREESMRASARAVAGDECVGA